MSLARRNDLIMVATGILVIFLDQLVKQWITQYFTTGGRVDDSIPLLGNVLELIYVQNRGVAFSLLEGRASLYILIALAVAVVIWLYWRLRNSPSVLIKVIFGLIIGGAVGNLIDRLRLGYVVDFIHFKIPAIGFSFAVFNVADSSISVGVVLLIAVLLFSNRPTTHPATHPVQQPGEGEAAATQPRVRRRI
jgi:signal peptidase II